MGKKHRYAVIVKFIKVQKIYSLQNYENHIQKNTIEMIINM